MLRQVLKYKISRLKPLLGKLFVVSLLTSSLFLFTGISRPVYAAVNNTINYQSKIVVKTTGLNITTGSPACVKSGADTCDFQIRIWNNVTAASTTSGTGNLLFTQKFLDVEIGDSNGIFNLNINSCGSTASGTSQWGTTVGLCAVEDDGGDADSDPGVNFNRSDLFIEISFAPADTSGSLGTFSEVFTRTALKSVPSAIYAANAASLSGLTTSDLVQFATGTAQTTSGTNGLVDLTTTGTVSNALIKVNENGSGTPALIDLQTGGLSKFIVNNTGQVTASYYTSNKGVLYTDASGNVSQTSAPGNSQCLQTDGSGNFTWGTCGGGGGTYVNFTPSSTQGTTSTNSLIDLTSTATGSTAALVKVNENGSGTPVLLDLQNASTDAFVVDNNGNISVLGGAAHTIANNAGALNIDSASTGAINIGTGSNGKTITVGNNTGATALNFISGTGTQSFTSSATSNNAFVFTANSLSSGSGMLIQTSSSSGTGDLLRVNTTGTVANLFNVQNNGSSVFVVSQTQITAALPTQFSAPGDLSLAYDLQFTSQTTSNIKSYGPLTIESGENFESNNLMLKTYNSGGLVYVNGGGTTLLQATSAGQLQLPTTDSTGGLLIGGDTQIYRNAADVLRTPDALIIDGNVAIGTSLVSNIGVNISKVYAMTSPTSYYGSNFAVTGTGANAGGGLYGIVGAANAQPGTGNTDLLGVGFAGTSSLTTAGTLSNARGVYGAVINSSTGTIINSTGFYVDTPTNSGGGSITNSYGVFIAAQTSAATSNFGLYIGGASGAATNNYALYVASGTSQFNGSVGLGAELTLPVGTTPSVLGGNVFVTANVTATKVITNFLDGVSGQMIFLRINDAFTDFDCTSSNLKCGSTDISTPAAGDYLAFAYDGANWHLLAYIDSASNYSDGEGSDVAEYIPGEAGLQPGEILSIDPTQTEAVVRTSTKYQSNIAGVYSTKPFIINTTENGNIPMALVGRVPALVSNINGDISIGDVITSSNLAGYGMRSTRSGMIVGRAMEASGFKLSNDNCPTEYRNQLDLHGDVIKCGQILVLLQVGYEANPNVYADPAEGLTLVADSQAGKFKLIDQDEQQILDNMSLNDLMVANVQAGTIKANTLDATNINIMDQSLDSYIREIVSSSSTSLQQVEGIQDNNESDTPTISVSDFNAAEEYKVVDTTIKAGDLVQLKVNKPEEEINSTDPLETDMNTVEKTKIAYSSDAVGVVSGTPELYLSNWSNEQDKEHSRAVVMQGKVKVNVTTENGAIKRGDYLTVGKIAGTAMKATHGGEIIGIAMQDLSIDNTVADVTKGEIMVYLNKGFISQAVYNSKTDLESGIEVTQIADQSVDSYFKFINNTITTDKNIQTSGSITANSFNAAAMQSLVLQMSNNGTFKLLDAQGNPILAVNNEGKLNLYEGQNSSTGHAVLTAGTTEIVVNNASITASSRITLTADQFVQYRVKAKSVGVGFTIEITTPLTVDTNFDYLIIN